MNKTEEEEIRIIREKYLAEQAAKEEERKKRIHEWTQYLSTLVPPIIPNDPLPPMPPPPPMS